MTILFWKLLLVIINFTIFFYVVGLIIDHYNANHQLTSWASIFHILSSIWLTIRGLFWLLTLVSVSQWDSFTFYILYWIPNPLEFGSFMLLPLFFAQVIFPLKWRENWAYICPVYSSLILALIVFQAIWALLAAYDEVSCSFQYHGSLTNILTNVLTLIEFTFWRLSF